MSAEPVDVHDSGARRGPPSATNPPPSAASPPADGEPLPSWLDGALPEPAAAEDSAALPSWLDGALPEPEAAPPAETPTPAPAVADERAPFALEPVAPVRETGGSAVVYGVTARNTGEAPLPQFWIEHELPPGVRFLHGVPAPEFQDNCLVWRLGTLQPGARVPLEVHVQPAGRTLAPQATADFHACYLRRTLIQTRIFKPRLTADMVEPAPVAVGEPVDLWMEIGNRGNCPVEAPLLRIRLPAGLQHPRGPEIERRLGLLAVGEMKKVKLRLTAARPGVHLVEVEIAGEGVQAAGRTRVVVRAPALSVQLTGPGRCLLDRTIDYRLEIANTGDAAAAGVQVTHVVPPGLELTAAEGRPSHDPTAHCLHWTIAGLTPGQRVAYALRFKATAPGDYVHQLVAQGAGGLQASAEVAIRNEFGELDGSLDDMVAALERELTASAPCAADAAPTAVEGDEERHLIFTLGETEYGVPLANVLEIGLPLAITALPNTPDWLLGVANVRGDIVSVILLSRLLGLEARGAEHAGRLIVARSRGQETTTGFIVERVRGIRSLSAGRIRAPASPIEDAIAPFVRGVLEHADRLLVVLDLDRLLLSREMQQFEMV
ncbi:MAG: chemotaxis protein CheW [Planctomycetia bacterium]|nr:chemotaxis protein CheW [Planctomycetia bacterium]